VHNRGMKMNIRLCDTKSRYFSQRGV